MSEPTSKVCAIASRVVRVSAQHTEAAVDAHGQLPIYYPTSDTVTHIGFITDLVTAPDLISPAADTFRESSSETDTYSEFNDELDETTYIVRHGQQLDDPFPMTDLRKVKTNEPIDEGFWRSPAYVFQREGDFSPSK